MLSVLAWIRNGPRQQYGCAQVRQKKTKRHPNCWSFEDAKHHGKGTQEGQHSWNHVGRQLFGMQQEGNRRQLYKQTWQCMLSNTHMLHDTIIAVPALLPSNPLPNTAAQSQ